MLLANVVAPARAPRARRLQHCSTLVAAVGTATLLLAAPSSGALAQSRSTARSASATSPAPAYLARVDSSLLAPFHYRMVGPNRGGRSTAVTGVASEPMTFYMGVASGGVWKTTDAGQTWFPITDGQIPLGSIGAIEVAPSNPNIVYVGTGSDDIRSNVSIGRGVYKSTDAGRTWTFVGLRDAGQIGAVRVDPTNADIVFVSAVGNPFVPNAERGVFRSKDGGATWQKVLFVSDSTGASDVELQPGTPTTVFAWMWHGQRKPWTIVSGALEGGFYKSTDDGDHWTKITNGLPTQLIGKGNIAVTAADPQRLYALVEAKPGGGLYRSDDAGASWSLVNMQPSLITRPFYYNTLGADPTNRDVVYGGAEGFFKSTDGGKTFHSFPVPHGDNHDIWINPHDGQVMIQANDGGANVSLNGGRTWSTQYNQPTAEIYQIATDSQVPYRIYGAQQDNTTVIVPSLPLNTGQAEEWRTGPGCETGPIIPIPTEPDTVYGSCKGQFSRMNLKTGQEQQYWVGAQSLYGNTEAQLIYRFQRVSPMEMSPFDPRTLYYGSQYVHRTHDEGVHWARISPDLTAYDPRYRNAISGEPITRDMTGEEVYATLYAIRESPLERGVIWTGSNDGPFHVTRDDGKTWTDITPKDLAPGGRVQNIEPSPHRRGSAYYAVYRYLLGDFHPYIYETRDYGKTWKLLTDGRNGIPEDTPTRVVREDPVRPGLLYAGTEFGMYISFDDGAHWQPFQQNLPATPITDLQVKNGGLIVSTQGRSFWILDDLAPLEQMTDAIASAPAHLFAPATAWRMRYQAGGGFGRGRGPSAPQYIPPGAVIDYSLSGATPVTLDILDAGGKVIRSFSSETGVAEAPDEADDEDEGPRRPRGTPRLETGAGLHRFIWDLQYPGPVGGGRGPLAVPGRYTVRLTTSGRSETQPLVLREDPRVTRDGVTQAILEQQLAHNIRVRDLLSRSNALVTRVRAAERRFRGATGPAADTLSRLTPIAEKLLTPPIRYSAPGVADNIRYLYGMTTQADQRIGEDAIERYGVLKTQLDGLERAVDEVLGRP